MSIDDNDQKLADKHGFKVTIEGNRYIVTDPKLPKKTGRHEGGNLRALIYQAIREREEFLTRMPEKVKSNVVAIRPPAAAKPMKKGKLYHIKVAVYQDREATNEQILAILKQKGIESSIAVIASVRADFLSTLRFLEDLKPKLNGEEK